MNSLIEKYRLGEYGNWLCIGLLIALSSSVLSESSKLTNNLFYGFVLIPGLFFLIKDQQPVKNTLLLLVGGYLTYVAISSFWSPLDISDSIKNFKHVLYFFTFYCTIHYLIKNQHLCEWHVFAVLIASVICVEAFSLTQYWINTGFSTWINRFPRLDAAGMGNPVYLSAILVVSSLSLIAILNVRGMLFYFLLLLIFLIILPFQSRSSLIGFLVGAAALVFQRGGLSRFLIFMAFPLLIIIVFNEISGRALSFHDYRLRIWLIVLQQVLDDCTLWLGCGYGHSFDIAIKRLHFLHPHSVIFSQFFYGGILGAILFSSTFLYILIRLFKAGSAYFSPIIAALAIMFFIGHRLLENPDVLWCILWLPLFLAISQISNKVDNPPIKNSI